MSAEELKSDKEVYSRVAVVDIEISVGTRNIYIGRRSKRLGWCSPQLVVIENVQY
jgi:hypothetical protein